MSDPRVDLYALVKHIQETVNQPDVWIDIGGVPVRASGYMMSAKSRREEVERFGALLIRDGATFADTFYRGAQKTHLVQCARGHCIKIKAGEALYRKRILCRECEPYLVIWTAYYVVHNPIGHCVKFGVTGGNPQLRLNDHRRDGFVSVLRLLTNLPAENVPKMEKDILEMIRVSGAKPIRGREYFTDDVLPVLLNAVDNYPIASQNGS